MAGMSLTMLTRLLPIKTAGQLNQALDGIGVQLDAAKAFLQDVQVEALPSTATAATIDLWLQALGVFMPAGSTLAEKRIAASSAYSASGGQNIAYIRGIVNQRFPDVTIAETGPFNYRLDGFYQFSRDYLYLLAILQRIAPAHLEAIFNVRPVFDGDVARCGIGIVGRAICGRGSTAYTPTEGTIARCGIGRIGLAITGRTAVA